MSKSSFQYFKGNSDKDFNIASMKKYTNAPQEIDKFFGQIISPFIKDKELKILDACCGVGHLSSFLSVLSPQSKFLGVDGASYLIEEAQMLYKDNKNLSFEVGDVYDLPNKYKKEFDISLSWKTLSWLPYYDRMLGALIAVTKKHIFLSSLFYDGDIDFEIRVREFKKEAGKENFNAFYNVYSFPNFKRFIERIGVQNMEARDFEIGIDLPRGSLDQMGTYTAKLENGKRLQISGVVVMNWKIIRLDL